MYLPSPSRLPARLKIREATDADFEQLEAIYLRVFPNDRLFADFLEFLQTPKSYLFVAEVDGEVVGFGGSDISGDQNRTHLQFGTVDPKWQGQGIGSLLFVLRVALADEDFDPAMVLFNAAPEMHPYYTEKMGAELIGESFLADENALNPYGLWISIEERAELLRSIVALPFSFNLDEILPEG